MSITYRLEKGSELTHEEMDANFRSLDRNLVVRPIAQDENGIVPILDVRDVQIPQSTTNLALLFVKVEGYEIVKVTDNTDDMLADMYNGFVWSDGYSSELPSVLSDNLKYAVLLHIDNDGKVTIASDEGGVYEDYVSFYSSLDFFEIEEGLFGVKPVGDGKLAVGTITVSTVEFVNLSEVGVKIFP